MFPAFNIPFVINCLWGKKSVVVMNLTICLAAAIIMCLCIAQENVLNAQKCYI